MTRNSTGQLDFSLILALYNEGPTLPQSLRRIFEVLNNSDLAYEILLIDDTSRDQTAALAQDAIAGKDNCRFIQHQKNVGRGGTVQEGFQLAHGRVVGFMDVDLEVDAGYMPGFIKQILAGRAEAVTGSRQYQMTGFYPLRFISTYLYRWLVRLSIGLPFQDTETGYKFFNREKLLPVLERIKDRGWFWDTEIMAWSYRAGLRVQELPVVFKKRLDKKSTVKIFKDSFEYLIKLIKFSRRFKEK